jgi:REP element-mobilizing transposase RayT
MLTWTTYGTWLQGDTRGYVKDGKVFGENARLREANEAAMSQAPFTLAEEEKEVVRDRIREQSRKIGQQVLALSVQSNHVHMAVRTVEQPVAAVVQMYKRATTNRLRDFGVKGKVWTRGYYVGYCYDEAAMRQRIEYVLGHGG